MFKLLFFSSEWYFYTWKEKNIKHKILIILVVIFFYCCPHLYCGKLKQVLATVSSDLLQVSLVYLGIEMIQPGKSFLKFDCWSNKAFKNYEDLIQIMM